MRSMIWLLGSALLLSVWQTTEPLAQDLPPGVTMELVKEHPASMVPGAKKISEFVVVLMPGAKIENYTPAGTGYCTTIFGEFTVDLGGKIIKHKAGEIHIEEAGVPFTVWNEGTVPAVDRMFEVIWQ